MLKQNYNTSQAFLALLRHNIDFFRKIKILIFYQSVIYKISVQA